MKSQKQVEKRVSSDIQRVAGNQLIVQALQNALILPELPFKFVHGRMHDFVAETL
jgi:hypothetical protein